MISEKMWNLFRNCIGYFAVLLISGIFIASSIFTIEDTGKTIQQILADGVLPFFLGISINVMFDMQGIMNGSRDDKVMETNALHGKIVTGITPYINRLDKWCDEQNAMVLKRQRTMMLANVGLRYEDCFEENGVAKPYTPLLHPCKTISDRMARRERYRVYRKACKLKLTKLNASDLTSEGCKHDDPLYLGRTKPQYSTFETAKDIVSKVIASLILGYYGVQAITEFNLPVLIYKCLQVSIFLIFGVIKMYKSYMFVTDEYRSRTIRKIDNLQKFENYIKQEEQHNDRP